MPGFIRAPVEHEPRHGYELSKLIESRSSAMPFETSRFDALTVGAVGGVLAVVALLACVIPARRATSADPVTALRVE